MNQKIIEIVKELEKWRIKEFVWWARQKYTIGKHKHMNQIDNDFNAVYCVIKKYYPNEFREGLTIGRGQAMAELDDRDKEIFRYHSDFLFK